MKVLLDHNVDRRLRRQLPGHEIVTTREMGWERLTNGQLLQSAASDGFEVVLSVDKKLQHEQNLSLLPIAVIVLDATSNALPGLTPFVPHLLRLLASPLQRYLFLLQRDGTVVRLGSPTAAQP